MRPISIKRLDESKVVIAWDTGHQSPYPLKFLRELCPCASCKGESVLLHHYAAAQQGRDELISYDLIGINPVGSYAIQLQWGDGHNTGIYTWDLLAANCPCEECTRQHDSLAGESYRSLTPKTEKAL